MFWRQWHDRTKLTIVSLKPVLDGPTAPPTLRRRIAEWLSRKVRPVGDAAEPSAMTSVACASCPNRFFPTPSVVFQPGQEWLARLCTACRRDALGLRDPQWGVEPQVERNAAMPPAGAVESINKVRKAG